MQRLVFLAVAAAAPIWAQTVHIGDVNGNVTVQTGSGPAVAAASDTLAIAGTTIVTAAHSTAMLDFDWSHSVEVGPNAEFRLASLGAGHYEAGIVRGSVTWWVRGDGAARAEVKTPSVTVAPARPGTYGIGVTSRGESEVTAWEGMIEVIAPGGSQWVNAGQKLIARGSPADPEYRMVGAVSRWKRAFRIMASAIDITTVAADVMNSGSGAAQGFRPGHAAPNPPSHPPSHPSPHPPGHGSPPGSGHAISAPSHTAPPAHISSAAAAPAAHTASAPSAPPSHRGR